MCKTLFGRNIPRGKWRKHSLGSQEGPYTHAAVIPGEGGKKKERSEGLINLKLPCNSLKSSSRLLMPKSPVREVQHFLE